MAGAADPAAAAPPSVSRGAALYMLLLLCLVNAFNYVDRSMLALVMPQMTKELQLSDTVTGLVAGLPFALCYASCAIPLAWVADRYNRRNLLAGALAGWSVVTALTGAAQSGWQLAAARFALGAGESAGHPTTASLIAGSFALKDRTAAFSALSASAYLGPFVGFPIVGWLLAEHGWRAAYYATGIAGVAMAAAFFLTVREPPRGQAGPAVPGGGGFVAGVRRLLATPSYRLVVLAGGFSAVNQGAHLTWGPTFLARVHHLDPQAIGLYFGTLRGAAGLAGALFAAVVVGMLVRRDIRWQVRVPILVAGLPFLSDLLFLAARDPLLWQAGLALSAFVTAIAVALSYPLYVNIAPPGLRATASAFYFLVASLMGFILGPLTVGALSDVFAAAWGAEAITVAMAAASGSALLSFLLLLRAGRSWTEDVARAEGAA
ncbi:MFS transporter [Sphingomonas canadensis]|uniref:MFS transporter n=1 Tax=Sphingomonas canadensis TaxID=1219257 RepID=A0ABW3HH17_9SPHN|nr:MFS transporter [Sphingomonas canadensis]MCW3838324.1 MFS transporter [Sphingomonas canadensis]